MYKIFILEILTLDIIKSIKYRDYDYIWTGARYLERQVQGANIFRNV